MTKHKILLALALASSALILGSAMAVAADEPAKVAGAWELTAENPRGTNTQTMTIEQDGSKIKGTLKGTRGERAFEGTISGDKIAFTVKIETQNGTFSIEYSGTVTGDSMSGTSHSERFDGKWTAKRSEGGGAK